MFFSYSKHYFSSSSIFLLSSATCELAAVAAVVGRSLNWLAKGISPLSSASIFLYYSIISISILVTFNPSMLFSLKFPIRSFIL